MNQKGQMFTTFKILIAAVVAMAILALLLPIITRMSGFITTDPTDDIARLMEKGSSNVGSTFSKEITFSDEITLTRKTFSEKMAMTEDHVCFGNVNEDAEKLGFSVADNELSFDGSGARKIKVKVGCDSGEAPVSIGCDCGISGLCCGVLVETI